MIKYISTRGKFGVNGFEDVLLAGLAPDGGLYVPETIPQIDVKGLVGKSYAETALAVMYPFVEGFVTKEEFSKIITDTYGPAVFRSHDVTPLHPLQEGLYILEQFHGPTIAFKDVALQLLGRLFDHALKKRNERITIVGATSGDTGSAAIEGCKTSNLIDIFILHPRGRVSDVQRKQMTTVRAPNVHNIAIEGSFDDCQNMVKAMFNDDAFRKTVNLSAVNSINWARIMAQIVYYFYSGLKLGAAEGKDVSFVVPTGNFGNVLAAYYARKMGLPIKTLGISSNKNDILTRFFETGEMRIGESHATLSPSMDIQISSNFERYLFDLFGRDSQRLSAAMTDFKSKGFFALPDDLMIKARSEFMAFRADDAKTLSVMKDIYDTSGYILDPHTAVGMAGALEMRSKISGNIVVLATAHPAKFPDAIEKAIGQRPPLPEHLSDLFEREEFMVDLPNDRSTVQNFVIKNRKG